METRGIKILAIDDNPDNLVVLKALLSETFPEANFIQSLSGEKGIALCLAENPDVILLDIVMPLMDGYEVCRRIKSNASVNYIPVVMVTASRGDTESRIKALECGADAFLAKPIDESELTAQIRAMVLIKEAEERKRDEKERLQEMVEKKTRELTEELKKRVIAEKELQQSFDKLEKSRQAELNLLEDLRIEIEERKQTEMALKDSDERFQLLFNKAPLGYQSLDINGNFIEVNQQWLDTLGYVREEVIGKWFGDFLSPEYKEGFRKRFPIFKEKGKIHSEFEMVHKNGNQLFIAFEGKIGYDLGGEFKQTHCILQDITSRKRTEDALKDSEERFRSLYENAPIGIYRTTPDGQILLANHMLVKMLGYKSLKELIHRDLKQEDHYEPQYSREKFKEKIEREGKIKGLETSLKRKDGSIVYIRESAVLVKDDFGNPLYYDGTIEDITERKLAEKALKESEGRFRSLFENMVEGFAYCKILYENGQPQDFIYLDVNQSFESLTGLKNVTGRKVSEVIPGIRQADPELFETYSRVALTGKPERFETYVEALKMWFHISVYSPAKEYFVAVFDVINERKVAEEALKESEEKYRRMVDITPDAVIIHADGNVLFVNPAALNLVGAISDDQLINQSILDFLHPDSKNIVRDRITQMFQTGKSAGFTELKFITLRNEIIDAEVIGIPINYMGKPAIQTVARDITNRKIAENALKESHEFNNSLLKTVPFGMEIVDETGTVLFLGENFRKIFGDRAIGKKCWELFRDDKTQCYDCPLRLGIKIGETNNYESSGVLGEKIFDINHTGMIYKGKKAMLEIFQDITERKLEEAELIIAKEKAEESDHLKSAFLATMNHELRTPLNHILGFSALIRSGVEEAESKEYASTIENSGKNLLSIIEDIFELSLVEQANIKVRRQTFSLMDHFMENKASLDDILRSSGKNEQIELIFKPDTGLLSSYITSDRSKINQVLANLFKNAVKFTHTGWIEFGYKMQNQGKLTFYVKDSGIGISNEKQSIIFDFFRQGDDTHTRLYGGIGIGLAISLKITQVLNGELKVNSEPGKGSTFSFTIPVEMADFGSQSISTTQHKVDLNLSGKTILIVEDDPFSMALMKNFMKSTNSRIIEASEGEEAIRKWKLHPEIDLILMDLKMPGMDGFEATKIIKSEKQEMPIIALTAYSLTSDKDKALCAGCDTIVAKPVDKALLFAEIKKCLVDD